MKNLRVGLVHKNGFDHTTIPENLLSQLIQKLAEKETEFVHTTTKTYEVQAIVIGDMTDRVLIGGRDN
ncbi:hypothetical protein ACW2QC_09270 [Virgibacillus sp. FSP13]